MGHHTASPPWAGGVTDNRSAGQVKILTKRIQMNTRLSKDDSEGKKAGFQAITVQGWEGKNCSIDFKPQF